MVPASPIFSFLAPHDPVLVRLAALAEGSAIDDPNTALLKLRQFGETLLQRTALQAVTRELGGWFHRTFHDLERIRAEREAAGPVKGRRRRTGAAG